MGSSDSDGDDDDKAAIQSQVATMLGPVSKKIKKTVSKLEKLEEKMEGFKKFSEESLPEVRREISTGVHDLASKIERLQSEVVQLASKTAVEVAKQEQAATEQRLRASLDEARGKIVAQELAMQGFEQRIATMESAMRASELKLGAELTAATATVGQMTAVIERQRGELDARMSEVGNRIAANHDTLQVRLDQAEEARRHHSQSLATKPELAELAATVARRSEEGASNLERAQVHMRTSASAIEELQGKLSSFATVDALERLSARATEAAVEARALIAKVRTHVHMPHPHPYRHPHPHPRAQAEASGSEERASWEGRLMQRQHSLEASSHESRREWHRLAAQIEQLQTYVAGR